MASKVTPTTVRFGIYVLKVNFATIYWERFGLCIAL